MTDEYEWNDREAADALIAARPASPAPCQHSWRQYMERVEATIPTGLTINEPAGYFDFDGYFCVHCPARSDERRVITNPEAL